MSQDERFCAWIDSSVTECLHDGIVDFQELVARLPSIYPTSIIDSLARIKRVERGNLRVTAGALIDSSKSKRFDTVIESAGMRKLLPPHPLDFEWRFSEASSSKLLAFAKGLSSSPARVALVATPSVAIHSDVVTSGCAFAYFGKDVARIRSVALDSSIKEWHHVDLSKRPTTYGSFDAVIMDPPWYSEYVYRFLWFASSILELGGHLLLSLPGAGTRASVVEDMHLYKGWWESLGFIHARSETQSIPYNTPFFEYNALLAAGVANFSSTWRRGDLIHLQRTQRHSNPWPGDVCHTQWVEFAIDKVRIRIDPHASCTGRSPRLVPLLAGDVLPSVSRRHPLRSKACVWTSGNRIFDCEAPMELAAALGKAANYSSELNSLALASLQSKGAELGDLKSQLERLVEIETNEILSYQGQARETAS
ncbi:MAG: hypothetical protein JNM79_17195 [Burkholderiales bacterium]|nr:hypothetical protein [Burkholderiales bacterium]